MIPGPASVGHGPPDHDASASKLPRLQEAAREAFRSNDPTRDRLPPLPAKGRWNAATAGSAVAPPRKAGDAARRTSAQRGIPNTAWQILAHKVERFKSHMRHAGTVRLAKKEGRESAVKQTPNPADDDQ